MYENSGYVRCEVNLYRMMYWKVETGRELLHLTVSLLRKCLQLSSRNWLSIMPNGILARYTNGVCHYRWQRHKNLHTKRDSALCRLVKGVSLQAKASVFRQSAASQQSVL